jgi:hypothetical protein
VLLLLLPMQRHCDLHQPGLRHRHLTPHLCSLHRPKLLASRYNTTTAATTTHDRRWLWHGRHQQSAQHLLNEVTGECFIGGGVARWLRARVLRVSFAQRERFGGGFEREAWSVAWACDG